MGVVAMNAIRVLTTITTDTLRIPALKRLMGKKVEITVVEEPRSEGRTRKAVGVRKGKGKDFSRNFGAGWPDDVNDGFEDAVANWRHEDQPRELPE